MASQLWDRHTRLQEQIGTTEDELRKSEDRLKQTIEAAARSEQLAALGRLAAGVAHEIRTPLTSLKLFLQSLREDADLPPDQVEDLAIALRQGQRMEATINQFLDFARPRDPCPTDVDFAKLVDDALLVVQPRANHQEVEITKSVAPGLPHVKGDGRQLGEALVNLLVNALEVMPEGGRLTITVASDAPQADGSRRGVRIDVADTGPGVPPADLSRLFEPFFTTKAAGSGLGLAIVRQTVQRHGGAVSVRSEPGAGTTFSLSLPASDL
jgi:signal transduction histidine kinase